MFDYNSISHGNRTYIIAEMSANHAGKLENALQIVRAAAEAGADCVKVQTYTPDTITMQSDKPFFRIQGGVWDGYSLYELYQEAHMPWAWHRAIQQECARVNVDFLSTPFDKTATDFLEDLNVEFYKIASFELVDIPLIGYVASKGKPMIISCGMGSFSEIQDAVDACIRVGNPSIILLKCCSEYPAKWESMNLATIRDMKERFNLPIGMSDHSMGDLAATVGVSLGACVIEKHFCIDRDLKNPDSDFSMEPVEFARMVKNVRAVESILGNVYYGPSESEMREKKNRRSLFAVKDIKKGETVTLDNVRSIRPANGLAPKYLPQILGKQVAFDVQRGDPISWEMIEKQRRTR